MRVPESSSYMKLFLFRVWSTRVGNREFSRTCRSNPTQHKHKALIRGRRVCEQIKSGEIKLPVPGKLVGSQRPGGSLRDATRSPMAGGGRGNNLVSFVFGQGTLTTVGRLAQRCA